MSSSKRPKKHSTMTENRTVERRQLVFYLRVFDLHSREIIGHLTDISTAGLMPSGSPPGVSCRRF
ncbi:MAG: hypothetical protein P8X86_12410 [Desulfofustis sp.]